MYEVRIGSMFNGLSVVVNTKDDADRLEKIVRSSLENTHLSVETTKLRAPFFVVEVTPDREKIRAVKAVRQFTNLGLVAAKTLVESSGFIGTYSLDEVQDLRTDLNAAGYTLLTEKELHQRRAS